MRIRTAVATSLAAACLVPAVGTAATQRTSFQMLQVTPSRVWAETSFMADAFPGALRTTYRYRYGGHVYVGRWYPAAAGTGTATEAMTQATRQARIGMSVTSGIVVDRDLTPTEAKRFRVLVDLYRDADVLVVAAGHPACAGLTAAQARAIATGAVTDWSQVGAGAGRIAVHHPIDGFGDAVPHMGTRFVKTTKGMRVNYAAGAVGARDGGVSAARAGDMSVAAVTTWGAVRRSVAGVCSVPLNGVAPTDRTVVDRTFPEAFPVRYVVLTAVTGRTAVDRGHIVVMRRAMTAHLRSERLRAMLRRQGVLVTGDPLPAG